MQCDVVEELLPRLCDVKTHELTRVLKAARREKYEQAAAVHRDAQLRFIMEMAEKSQSDFDNTFTCEERKVMAARAYWARSVAEIEQTETPVGAVGEQAELAGEAAGGVHQTTVERWMYDFQSNGGLFSEALWGKNTKTPSMLGEVTTRPMCSC